jgi:hypothetical protein
MVHNSFNGDWSRPIWTRSTACFIEHRPAKEHTNKIQTIIYKYDGMLCYTRTKSGCDQYRMHKMAQYTEPHIIKRRVDWYFSKIEGRSSIVDNRRTRSRPSNLFPDTVQGANASASIDPQDHVSRSTANCKADFSIRSKTLLSLPSGEA